MINSDSYYEIGAGHTFCEDYADHGEFKIEENLFRFAIVCDGCSNSKGSDIGARLLAKWFPRAFASAYDFDKQRLAELISLFLIGKIETNTMRLMPENYDATVVALVYDVLADTLYSFVWGDGKVYYKYKTGENGYLIDVGFPSNAPYYLSYRADKNRDAYYEPKFGKLYADIVSYAVKPDGLVHLPEANKSFQKFHFEEFPKASENLSHASVFTDGIDTFHLKDNVDVQMQKQNLYNQLTQYKGTHGEFVKRRMNAVKKFCQKEGWQHFDDISVATISFAL